MENNKSKTKRTTIGNIFKGKVVDGKQMPDYIKIKQDVTLKADTYLNLESKKQREESIRYRLSKGWISEQKAGDLMTQTVEKWPDFIRFDVVLVEDRED